MNTLYGAVRVERLSPPVASRLFAYAGVGLYSGMAATNPKLPSFAGKLNGLPELPSAEAGKSYEPVVTAVAAERVILDTLFREGLATTRASLNRLADSLANARVVQGIDADTRMRSEQLGRRIGLSIIAWSHQDGFDSTRGRKYVPPSGAGLWINDSPTTTYSTQNLSGASQEITFDNPANIQAGATNDRALILDRPKNAGRTRTLPAANMAQMVSEQHLSAEQSARLMALTGISLADAFISAWGYKFQLNLIRPRTFIRATMDSTWEPAIPTPPFPEYLSGHSAVSAAAAATLTAVLGPVPFSDSTSVSIGHAVRNFASFRAAADEAGLSRIYGGIHFPSGNTAGGELGRCVASRVLTRLDARPQALEE